MMLQSRHVYTTKTITFEFRLSAITVIKLSNEVCHFLSTNPGVSRAQHPFGSRNKFTFFSVTDFCNPNPCLHNGVCAVQETGYKCRCLPQFTGFNCEGNVH